MLSFDRREDDYEIRAQCLSYEEVYCPRKSALNHSVTAVPFITDYNNRSYDCQLPYKLDIQETSGFGQFYGVHGPVGSDLNHTPITLYREHWHNKKADTESFKPGDMVHINRGWYYHCGIYVGGGKLVHLSGFSGSMESGPYHSFTPSGVVFEKGIVRIDNLSDVAGATDTVWINAKDTQLVPLESSVIVSRSLSKVGEVGYNLFSKNCEHLATWCRYNIEESDQIIFVKLVAVVALVFCIAFGWMCHKIKSKRTKMFPLRN